MFSREVSDAVARWPRRRRGPGRGAPPGGAAPVQGSRQRSVGHGRMGPMAESDANTPAATDAVVDAAPASAREEHRALSEEIEDARWRYYVLDDPTLSDADFDQRMRRLEAL